MVNIFVFDVLLKDKIFEYFGILIRYKKNIKYLKNVTRELYKSI